MSRSAWLTWFPRTPRLARNQRPVPLAPRHRRVWRGLRRYCSCGLRWRTCPDRYAAVPTEPTTPVAPAPPPNRPRWASATMANPQFGRVGRLTVAQSWRANGGRW
ncbi:hypothetical protein [Micromonospora sp. WMMD1082]|uniref:hypothetical protein n=1 Tax=Micromonospora sp. WMMD1082 TaxID=3016104 RepID=UPI0024170B2D|nr:hypothetical protein [Micromonospora sp. WMMD1082]MDG4794294.1 hypothetical protein [Micromonospora sp. WMMD1082]